MSAFEKLQRAHAPLKAYSITKDSNIGFELSAYGAGFDMLQAELEKLEQEAFVGTAEDFGLSAWEKLWGAPRGDLSAKKRREMILARMAFGYEDFTLEGMNRMLRFLGVEGAINEYPDVFRVTVDIKAGNLTKGQRNWISAQLKAVMPAHIEVDAVFAGFDWDNFESRNLTFDSLDKKALLWSDIDIYVG